MYKGIDVSSYQKNIDWEKVKADGIEFAIIRLGWIGNKSNHTIDDYFERNYNECQRLGIATGVYVYNYCESDGNALEGANWTLGKLAGKKLQLPIYLDMEDSQISKLSKDSLTSICITFNTAIENAGYWAGVYANKNWFENYLNKNILEEKYTCWVAQYSSNCTYSGKYDIWQYTSSGKVKGIVGNVDMNYMYRDLQSEIGNKTNIRIEENEEVVSFMKKFKNGTTIEPIYAEPSHENQIGHLNVYEECDCFGIINGAPIVRYKIDGTNQYKVGFAVDTRCVK